jgi:hypothetical protein
MLLKPPVDQEKDHEKCDGTQRQAENDQPERHVLAKVTQQSRDK